MRHTDEGRAPDEGSISLFILGLCVIGLVLVLGVVTVTSAQLARMRLLDAADAAALDAADSITDSAYTSGIGDAVPLSDAMVSETASAYLASRPLPERMESWSIAPGTGTPDGSTAVVVVTGTADLPVVTPLLEALGGSITITVESRARADVENPAP
ncbi:MAG: pilus assembly protein TadG-related protein [Dermatophilaceae bacterium]